MIEKLEKVLPSDIFEELKEILSTRTVSKAQLIQLLANCEHECKWKNYVENTNYSAERLFAVFPKRVKTLENAKLICSKGSREIANFLYNGRMGNRLNSNDGTDYKGKGSLQITGYENYKLFDATVPENITLNPELVATKYKLRVAFWFFDVNKLWGIADSLSNEATEKLRLRINGGFNGVEEVKNLIIKYKQLIP